MQADSSAPGQGYDVASLIDFIVDSTGFRAHLDKHHGSDATERWENVKELKNYAALVAEENPADVDLKTELIEMEEVQIGVSPSAAGNGFFDDEAEFGEEELKPRA